MSYEEARQIDKTVYKEPFQPPKCDLCQKVSLETIHLCFNVETGVKPEYKLCKYCARDLAIDLILATGD